MVMVIGSSNEPPRASLTPSEHQLYRCATDLLPNLNARIWECDSQRRLPAETMDDFRRAGFFKILQPAKYGGYECNPRILLNIARIVARACPSSAWCLSVFGVHAFEAVLTGTAASDDIWEADSDALISSSYVPGNARVTRVADGFELAGRWQYSSGCDFGNWAMVGGLVTEGHSERPSLIGMLLPRSDYTIDQSSWNTMGMRGTGSKDIVVADAFVPLHRAHPIGPGGDSYQAAQMANGSISAPCYKYPIRTILSYALSAVLVGAAEGAFAHFVTVMKRKSTGAPNKNRIAALNKDVAEASALIDAANLRMDRDWMAMERAIDDGATISIGERVSHVWNSACNARDCMRAIEMLFHASGAGAADDSSVIQRFYRDASVMVNHAALSAGQRAIDYGHVVLGADPAEIGWPEIGAAA